MTGIPSDILALCARAYFTSPRDVIRGSRGRNIGRARAATVFVLRECRQVNKIAFSRIATVTGHSAGKSVWYWWLRAKKLRDSDERFRLMTDALLAASICPPRANLADAIAERVAA